MERRGEWEVDGEAGGGREREVGGGREGEVGGGREGGKERGRGEGQIKKAEERGSGRGRWSVKWKGRGSGRRKKTESHDILASNGGGSRTAYKQTHHRPRALRWNAPRGEIRPRRSANDIHEITS